MTAPNTPWPQVRPRRHCIRSVTNSVAKDGQDGAERPISLRRSPETRDPIEVEDEGPDIYGRAKGGL